ncbi:hypothetical protein HGI47_03680 [Novosphingobium sp. ERN07]|uniref:hypothetical protein n=1 Tax=Novosphingobium sp. ERN07 TaxID=2726187 RepID=UPI001456D364|nr:hypothetical protein [Novosphingobium sp. ERN07]NLR69977.1 hypothetical protein [Novosphingobium sp. ERN07]
MPGDDVDPRHRIALAYAPKSARPAWYALLLLERKLAEAARPGRDPMMIQLRLAWWRDRLGEESARWPVSEPAFAHLRAWQGKHQCLSALVDGWEATIVGEDEGRELAAARVASYVALAELLGAGSPETVRSALHDIDYPQAASPLPHALPRAMRPLAVLRALALRKARGGRHTPFSDLARVIWAGLLGR